MSAVAVWLDIVGDWVAVCDDSCNRPLHMTASNWGDAYEVAVGHAAVRHPRPACSCPTDAEIRAAIHHSHQQLTGGTNA